MRIILAAAFARRLLLLLQGQPSRPPVLRKTLHLPPPVLRRRLGPGRKEPPLHFRQLVRVGGGVLADAAQRPVEGVTEPIPRVRLQPNKQKTSARAKRRENRTPRLTSRGNAADSTQ
jgi:hypothetical protein